MLRTRLTEAEWREKAERSRQQIALARERWPHLFPPVEPEVEEPES